MGVGVGSLVDPKNFNGLAHFCEHMLSMGTEKNPGIKEYSESIATAGGWDNAFTMPWMTNYHYTVSNEELYKILTMFADQFISPKFDASAVDNEINAVNSEAVNSYKSDSRRIYGLQRLVCDKDSPLSNYQCGNLDTLKKEGVREQMIQYYEKYYSSDIMTLCVCSNKDLDDLESKVVELFSLIKNKNNGVVSFANLPSPYSDTLFSTLLKVVPLKEMDDLSLQFMLPSYYKQNIAQKPMRYYSH